MPMWKKYFNAKTIFIILDTLLAVYLVLAVLAFNKPEEATLSCKDVEIHVDRSNDKSFLTTEDVKSMLEKKKIYPLNKQFTQVDPRTIEETLRQNPFISSAECVKTKEGVIKIDIKQRAPSVRIMSDNGEDYCIDERDSILLSNAYTSNLIIATGNISQWYAKNYLVVLSRIIADNDFWNNQIEQINIRTDKTVELVPRVGDHIINIGRLPEHNDTERRINGIHKFVNDQLERLEKFYRYGLSEAGWNKYSYINLEFSNQIICKRNDSKKMKAENMDEESEATKEQPKKADNKPKKAEEKKADNKPMKADSKPQKSESKPQKADAKPQKSESKANKSDVKSKNKK